MIFFRLNDKPINDQNRMAILLDSKTSKKTAQIIKKIKTPREDEEIVRSRALNFFLNEERTPLATDDNNRINEVKPNRPVSPIALR